MQFYLYYLLIQFVYIIRYILEGKEIEFYMKKIQRKKVKGAGWNFLDAVFHLVLFACWLLIYLLLCQIDGVKLLNT